MEVYIIFQLSFFFSNHASIEGFSGADGTGGRFGGRKDIFEVDGNDRCIVPQPWSRHCKELGVGAGALGLEEEEAPPTGANEVKKKNHTKPRTGLDQREIFLRAPSNSCDEVYMSRR